MPATSKPELAAEKLLRDAGCHKVPVPLEHIAERLGIEIIKKNLGDELSGVLIKKEGESVAIVVNSGQHETRQRFTIAHELGHYALRHPGEMFVDETLRQKAIVVKRDGRSSEGTDRHEVEANRFAAELLMPRQMVEEEISKRLSKSKPTSETLLKKLVQELATRFNVSNQAMEIRLVNLGLLIPG